MTNTVAKLAKVKGMIEPSWNWIVCVFVIFENI